MQTFLPYADFFQSAKVLDDSRLNKQIVECQQIIKACLWSTDSNTGWANHSVCRMWYSYEHCLFSYADIIHDEYCIRNGKSHEAFLNTCSKYGAACVEKLYITPYWLGNEQLHSSHRSRLLLKGMLDVLRKRCGLDSYVRARFFGGRPISTFDLEDTQRACEILRVSFTDVLNSSHYAQFNWKEKPGDEYEWPSQERFFSHDMNG